MYTRLKTAKVAAELETKSTKAGITQYKTTSTKSLQLPLRAFHALCLEATYVGSIRLSCIN